MNMRPFFASSMISSGLERKAWRRCASVGLGLATIMLHALQVAGEHVDLDIDRPAGRERAQRRHRLRVRDDVDRETGAVALVRHLVDRQPHAVERRSEERRAGKVYVSKVKSWW